MVEVGHLKRGAGIRFWVGGRPFGGGRSGLGSGLGEYPMRIPELRRAMHPRRSNGYDPVDDLDGCLYALGGREAWLDGWMAWW